MNSSNQLDCGQIVEDLDKESNGEAVLLQTTLSIMVTGFGTFTNSISLSYFLQKKKKCLIDKMFILLNILDVIVCSLVTVDTIFRAWLEDRIIKSVLPFFILDSLVYFVIAEYTTFVMCLLSVTRSISLLLPLHVISGRVVTVSLLTHFSYVILKETTLFLTQVNFYLCSTPEVDKEISKMLHLLTLTTAVVIITVSAVLSSVKLYTTNAALSSGGEGVFEIKRKAALTIIILSTIFVIINSVYLAGAMLMITSENEDDMGAGFGKSTEDEEVRQIEEGEDLRWKERLLEAILRYALPLNSSLDPVVYFVRQEKLRKHVIGLWQRMVTRH